MPQLLRQPQGAPCPKRVLRMMVDQADRTGEVGVALTFTASARKLGMVSAVGAVFLIAVYAGTLIAGLRSLQSPQQSVSDPLFSILEILII